MTTVCRRSFRQKGIPLLINENSFYGGRAERSARLLYHWTRVSKGCKKVFIGSLHKYMQMLLQTFRAEEFLSILIHNNTGSRNRLIFAIHGSNKPFQNILVLKLLKKDRTLRNPNRRNKSQLFACICANCQRSSCSQPFDTRIILGKVVCIRYNDNILVDTPFSNEVIQV